MSLSFCNEINIVNSYTPIPGETPLSIIPNILSLLGASVVILSFIFVKALRNHHTFFYLIHLSSMEFIANLSTIIIFILYEIFPDPNSLDVIVEIIVFLQDASLSSAIIWTSIIAVNFYKLVRDHGYLSGVKSMNTKYLIIAYGLPVVINFLQTLLSIPSFYWLIIPLWISIATNIILYVMAALRLKEYSGIVRLSSGFSKYFWYPLIMIVCWVMVSWLITFSDSGCYDAEIVVAEGLARGQGFFNAVAYLMTRSIQTELKVSWRQSWNRSVVRYDTGNTSSLMSS